MVKATETCVWVDSSWPHCILALPLLHQLATCLA